MSGRNSVQPSFMPLFLVMVLITALCVKTWPMLESDMMFVPGILVLVAGAGWIQTLFAALAGLKNLYRRIRAFSRSIGKGSSVWATPKELKKAGLYNTEGVFLGLDVQTGKPLFFTGESHGLTLGPGGSSKTVNSAIPMLCHLDLPIIATDLKGTLREMTEKLRKKVHKQKTYAVDPTSPKSSRYNPLQILIDDWLEEHEGTKKDLIADAQNIALQLLPEPIQATNNKFFRNGSRKLIVFCLVYLVTRGNFIKATLSQVLRTLRDRDKFLDMLYIAACSEDLEGELATLAQDIIPNFEQQDTKQSESFREGATQALSAFAPSGWLVESTSTCDFRFRDLKDDPATVYLIVDPTRMEVFKPWLGLICWAALTELTRCRNNKPVFFLMDEATNFYINNLSNALTSLREYGIRVWFIVQELAEFSRVYGENSLQTMLSQTECKQILGGRGNSQKTAELISRIAGDTTIKTENFSLGHDMTDKVRVSVSEQGRKLLTSDEVRRCSDTLLFIRDLPPAKAVPTGYHEVMPWKKWVGINPLFGKPYKGKTKLWLRYKRKWFEK